MDADTFVRALAAQEPSQADLVAQGLSVVEASGWSKFFRFLPKLNGIPANDPLLDLVGRYDGSSVEITSLSFLAEPVQTEYGLQVGCDECDPVVIEATTGEVTIRELGFEWHIIGFCAKDGGAFLETLLTAGQSLNVDVDFATQDLRCDAARRCIEVAGGDKYAEFCYDLLGCESRPE